jgi:alkylated DNA repair dioxygenase AlkB
VVDDLRKYYVQTNASHLFAIPLKNADTDADADTDANELLSRCVNEVKVQLLHHPPIVVFGKQCNQQRNIGFFSNESIGYRYSNQLARSQPLTQSLMELLQRVNTATEADFNGILVNEYENGTDYIGRHSDETGLSAIGVACISYGAVRTFRIRDKTTHQKVADIPTTSDEIWVMGGQFQQEFTHEIPVEKKVKHPRISFTFRKHTM